jgi:hypothetical protein
MKRSAQASTLETFEPASQVSAERRVGELMAAQRETVGLNHGAKGTGSNQHEVRVSERPTPPTLADAGIDKHLADRARKIVKQEPDAFEAAIELLRKVCAAQERQGEEIAAIRRLLERGRGPRDAADAALVQALAESFRHRVFTSGHVLMLAEADPRLAGALEGADITSAHELGQVLSRLEGTNIRGLTLDRRADKLRGAIQWRCEVYEK